jgi:hypothetical protein
VNLYYESIIRKGFREWSIRVWRQKENPHDPIVMTDIAAALNSINRVETDAELVLKTLIALDGVNAVEVVNAASGWGSVVYKDWP